MRRLVVVGLLGAVCWSASACSAATTGSGGSGGSGGAGPGSGGSPQPAPPQVAIVDADAYGAIVVDGADRSAIGLRRDGTVAWRTTLDPRSAVPVACLIRCPDAVLSGGADAAATPADPDPDPVLLLNGNRQPLGGLGTVKRRVLSAAGPEDLVLALGDGAAESWLELRHAGQETRVPVPAGRTSWEESADGRWALALTALPGGGSQVRWYTRRDGAWQGAGSDVTVEAVAACVDPDGEFALLLGQRPALMDHAGVQQPVSDLGRAGTCARAATGSVLAELSWSPAGGRSRLRVLAGDATVTLRRDVPDIVAVSADPTASRVAYLAQGVLHEVDSATGAELRTVDRALALRYDAAANLIVVRADRTVEWLR